MVRPQALIIDLEGTVYTRDGVLGGIPTALSELRDAGHALRFLTNTDSESTPAIVDRVRGLGIHVRDGEVFTPVSAALDLLAVRSGARARVLPLTTPAVREELATVVDIVGPDEDATHVVVGDIRDALSYELLDSAFRALHSGVELIALQRGRFFLSKGRAHLDTGAIVAALEYAANTSATVVGKPSLEFLTLAARTIDPAPSPQSTWVIGDDRSTDIRMGAAASVRTVQVRTGKFALQDDGSGPSPDYVIDSLADLPELLSRTARAVS